MIDLSAGSQLGRYELLVRIGHGGMASVWVARVASPSGDRLVAVKAMLPELAHDPSFRSMFLEEVQIVRSIHHENVVRVHEVSEDQGILYMVMEWVEGDSLRNLIRQARRRTAIPSDIAVRIVADTAEGLHAAHELRGWDGELRQVVHCDVSPHNILVSIHGQAKVVDFGIANAMGTLKAEGQIRGKLGYMSPEQASGARLDRRSDVFSLGVVLYELATGEQLFKGRDPEHTLALVQHAQVPPPTSLRSGFPRALEVIVMKALERDPSRRFQTALDLRNALEAHLISEKVLVSHAAVAQLLTRVVGERIRKRREVLEAIATTLDAERGEAFAAGPGPLDAQGLQFWSHDATYDSGHSSMLTGSDTPLGVAARHQDTGAATTLGEAKAPRGVRIWLLAALAALIVIAVTSTAWHLSSSATVVKEVSGPPYSSYPPATPAATGLPPAGDPGNPEEATARSVDSLPLVDNGDGSRDKTRVSEDSKQETDPDGLKTRAQRLDQAPANKDVPSRDAPPTAPEPVAVQLTAAPEPTSPPADETPVGTRQKLRPLNKGAARDALRRAALSAAGCAASGSPEGAGSATVTFRPDGGTSAVSVSSKFVGTKAGNCVVARFAEARVPPFAGLPATMTQSFHLAP